jgi:formylglycine-generating enzyme required for sulfatase activity
MGEDGAVTYPGDGEAPVRTVDVAPLRISAATVTNAEFAAFVDETGHQTDAERFGWSFVFGGLLPDDFPDTRAVANAPWWRQVYDADWRRPEGPQSDLTDRDDHPVVHVSWTDAVAFAGWAGGRLPTEAEWEYAARAGTTSTFPWGDELEPDGEHRANVWQGEFPAENTLADGWMGTSPVGAFPPNDFGLVDAIGNVWEWTADWFAYDRSASDPPGEPVVDPVGPSSGTHRVMKGGSYLCHESYCRRYRPAARLANATDSSAGNIGFRIAAG